MADYVGKERCSCGAWASQALHYRLSSSKRNIYGGRKVVEVCGSCAERAVKGIYSPPYRVEPLAEWTAWFNKQERAKLGVQKRKLHRDQLAMDI